MTQREAKRLAWHLACQILSAGNTPEGFTAGAADGRRFERAWLEVLEEANRKGGSVYQVRLLAGLPSSYGT